MLQSIRDRLTGPIVWFVIGLIVIPFAFWGIESFRGGGGDPVVAKVGDQDITQSQLKHSYDQRYQQLQALMGNNFRPELFNQARFRQSVLDDMVQESALRQYARQMGYRADDAALLNYLNEVPAFQKDGKFSAEVYREALARQGMKPERFESQLRDSLVIDQMRGAVTESAFLTPADAAEAHRLMQQLRRITVAQLRVDAFREGINVTDAQVAERYASEKSRFMSPERLKLAYVELDPAKLPEAPAPAAEVLKVLYEAEKDARFATPEERHAKHILIGFGADKAAAKEKAEALLKQIKGGGKFADIASASSEDPGSKKDGGDLGWVRRGTMVPKFEEALFEMKAGEVVGPIETEFGWHLIRLEEVKAPSIRPYDDDAVQAELLAAYRQKEREKHFQDLSEKLEQLAFEKSTLEPIAAELGLQVQNTDWFGRASTGEGIVAVEGVRQAAFSPEVLNDDQNSKPISLGDGRAVVVHKAEYEPAKQQTLEQVSETLRTQLATEAAKSRAAAAADAVLAAVNGGQALSAAAGEKGATVIFEGDIKRDESKLDPAVQNAVFQLPRPKDGKAVAKRVELAEGNIAVVVLGAVSDPAPFAAGDAEAQRQAVQLRDGLGGSEMGAYRKAIEEAVSVKIKEVPPVASAESETPAP
jgi:peptidyl-prolyl cis-trans isomerase D